MEFVSAVIQKHRSDLTYFYSEINHIGRFGHFLQYLRRDSKRKEDSILPKKAVGKLTEAWGITGPSLLTTKQLGNFIEDVDEKTCRVLISDYQEVINRCYTILKQYIDNKILAQESEYLLIAKYDAIVPRRIEYFTKSGNPIKWKVVLGHLKDLGLLSEDSGYLFSPSMFKEPDQPTIDLLTEYDIVPSKLVESFEIVDQIPGLPLESLDKRIQGLIRESGQVGLLVPVTVEIGSTPKTFVFHNPTQLRNGDLSYEAAGFIRFNEWYAVQKYGRLIASRKFLGKLIDLGSAGKATNIGMNYGPLEVKGVIKIIETETSGRYMMVLQKQGVIEEVYDLLQKSVSGEFKSPNPPTWLTDPASFRASEAERQKAALLKMRKYLRDKS